MTNTAGGCLFLGVEDDGTITGVHKKHRDPIGVTALIANSTVPPIAVRAEIITEEDKDVLKIEVPRSRGVISTASGKILRRRNKLDGSPEVIPMYSYEIPSRLAELGMLDYSAQPLAGATLDDLDPNQRVRLRRIIQNRSGGEKTLLSLSDEELDIALRLVTNVAGNYVPTVTGMLLIGKEERIAELIPTAKAAFQVLEGTAVRVNEDSNKPLLELFESYETYVKAWNPERETEYGLFRIPIPEFDWAAFREGLVNAFCHRDYTVLGSVRVLIDDEGMTISNPGGFIDGVNLKNLLTVEPHGRNPALAVGFVGGMIASQGKSGFLGALVAGFAAGYIIVLLRKLCDKLPQAIEKIAPVLIYPVVGILVMGLLMNFAVEPIMGAINTALNNGLTSMGGSSKIILGFILGGMMAIDMGGPFNKASYVFGTAAIASGNYDVMAAVMIGGMTPPCAIALATLLFKNKFTKEERDAGPTNFIMGLAFITEGAIPFAASDPLHVLPACVIGSGIAGSLSMLFNCTLMAPHGGIFVFPVVGNPWMYLAALVVGTIVSTVLLGILKKKVEE